MEKILINSNRTSVSSQSFAVDGPQKIPLRAIVLTDGLAYILSWMLAVLVVCSLALAVHALVTGQQPEESWRSFFIGVAVMAAALYGVLRWRAASVARSLGSWHRTTARLQSDFSFGQWLRLRVCFEHGGRPVEQSVTLVRSKRSLALKGRSELTVVVHPHDPRRLTIAELYEREPDRVGEP